MDTSIAYKAGRAVGGVLCKGGKAAEGVGR
jgi:hypothetical protein